jgi:hypothetical protein
MDVNTANICNSETIPGNKQQSVKTDRFCHGANIVIEQNKIFNPTRICRQVLSAPFSRGEIPGIPASDTYDPGVDSVEYPQPAFPAPHADLHPSSKWGKGMTESMMNLFFYTAVPDMRL